MRAPQYGVNGYKARQRGRLNWLAPHRITVHVKGRTVMRMVRHKAPALVIATPKLWRAVALRGPNQPLPMRTIHYLKPRDVQYDNGAFGAACTLTLWHKSAIKGGVKDSKLAGPIVTKRYAVVVKRPRH